MSESIVEEGNKFLLAENYKAALSSYNVVLSSKPDAETKIQSLQKRSQCYLALGDIDHAIEDALEVIKSNPDITDGYTLHGKALTKANRFEDALMAFRKGLEIDPNDKVITENLREMQKAIVSSYEKKEKGKDMSYNAVNLCSQEPYPGDDELAEYEREIIELKGYNKLPSVYCGMPDPELALKYLQLARKENKAGNLTTALKSYEISLEKDPLNFDTWTEKAAILQKLERHGDAFQCVSAVPAECRSGDIWKLGGSILSDLDLPVTSETWLRRATQLSQRKDIEAATLFQKVRVHRLYDPMTKGTKVRIDFTEYGRAVVAKEDVKAGDIIFTDQPTVFAQLLQNMNVLACPNCAKSLMSPQDYFGAPVLKKNKTLKAAVDKYWPRMNRVPCTGCNEETYCSEQCREEAWNNYHGPLCPSINSKVHLLYDLCKKIREASNDDQSLWCGSFSPVMMARIWASIACHAKRLAKESGHTLPTQAQWALAKTPYRRFIAYGVPGMGKSYAGIYQVMRDIFNAAPEGMSCDISLRDFEGRYFQLACNVQCFSDGRNPLHCFLKSISDKQQYAHLSNLVDPDNVPEANFSGVFPVQACFNHSCANTAEVMDGVCNGRPGIQVRARMDVKAGNEIFTSYIDTSTLRRERRALLFRGYNFWCNCLRCQYEGDGPEICANCETKAPEGKQFPACGKCRKIWYCSPKCQKISWKAGHKIICSMTHSKLYLSSYS